MSELKNKHGYDKIDTSILPAEFIELLQDALRKAKGAGFGKVTITYEHGIPHTVEVSTSQKVKN